MIQQERVFDTAIYIRLSKEDQLGKTSASVRNQEMILTAYIRQHPQLSLRSTWIDDGYSGLDFNRPGIQGLFEDINQGRINCVLVKDLSRFGRNYIETGRYLEQIFPAMGVRFIALGEGYDSLYQSEGFESVLLPFQNLLNDAYSGDISQKVRSQLVAGWKEGWFMGAFPPYGYVKSQQCHHRLCVDPLGARVVRGVFRLKIAGSSQQQIADVLNETEIPCPCLHKKMLGMAYETPFLQQKNPVWTAQAVTRLLKDRVYLGELAQGKETRPNYKIRKKVKQPKEQWVVTKHCHPALITEFEFELVQRLLATDTRVSPKHGRLYFFSGLLSCGCCNAPLVRRPVTIKGKSYLYYVCKNHKENREVCGNGWRLKEECLWLWFETMFGKGNQQDRSLLVFLVKAVEIYDDHRVTISYHFCEEGIG